MVEEIFPATYEWNISGSQGRDFLGGRFQKLWIDANGLELTLSEVAVTSLWPDRSAAKYSFLTPPKDTVVTLSQVVMAVEFVRQLILRLNDWLESSADVSVNLCPKQSDQRFIIELGPTKIPNSLKKVALQVEYFSGAFMGKWSFEVDQSCIRLFVDELSNSLKSHSLLTEPTSTTAP
jgi:hypothetical protein